MEQQEIRRRFGSTYVWGGELSNDPDFFQPVEVEHLGEYGPPIKPCLSLAPGWRVQPGGAGHQDAWFDPSLLQVD